MNLYIKKVGAFSNNGKINILSFEKGLNIITGESKTGKSAIIEIVDYCFLNSINNIPKGIIEDNCNNFFIVLKTSENKIVLARESYFNETKNNGKNRAFLKFENSNFNETDITKKYFVTNKNYFRPISEIKIELLKIFKIKTLKRKDQEDKTKTPSIRNICSFIFQHQTLIANKFALFYRADEFVKRKSLIEELPILLGIVDQNYYNKFLEKQTLEKTIKKLKKEIEFNEEHLKDLNKSKEDIEKDINIVVTETKINLDNPKIRKELIAKKRILEKKIQIINNKLFEIEFRTEELNDLGISKMNMRKKIQNKLVIPFEEIKACPFCHSKIDNINSEIKILNKNKEEILNFLSPSNELSISVNQKLEKLLKEENQFKNELKKIKKEYRTLEKIFNAEENKSEELKEYLERKKITLKLIKEEEQELLKNEKKQLLKNFENDLLDIKNFLERYDVTKEITKLNYELADKINKLINKFDFEKSLGEPNFFVELEKLQCYHKKNKDKIYLSSMGSGANWLSVHLSLFLALNYIFSKYSNKISIPNILFLDQPSQVYFPDGKPEAEAYSKVENIYTNILKHIDKTEEETKNKPQIIIIDHADNLKLENYNYKDYVRANWHGEGIGFITYNRD